MLQKAGMPYDVSVHQEWNAIKKNEGDNSPATTAMSEAAPRQAIRAR